MTERSYALTETISNLLMQQPFIAVLLIDLTRLVEDENLPYPAATDGRTIYINPKDFSSRPIQHRVFILAHEVLHCIYQHPQKTKHWMDIGFGPDGKPYNTKKMNIAEDFIINSVLLKSSIGKRPEDGCFNKRYNHTMTSEEVYRLLEDPEESDDKNKNFDLHMAPGDAAKDVPSEAEIQRALVSAASAAKAQGKMPAGMDRLIKEILEPKQDWKEVLRDFVVTSVGKDEPSWRRINRRRLAMEPVAAYPGLTGSRIGNIGLIVDTSGSISAEELQAFLSEISGILEDTTPERAVIFWTDSAVAGIDEIDEDTTLTELVPKGGGGTDMPAAFPVIDKEFSEGVQCIVCLTDGYTGFDPEPGVPILWVITTNIEAPYGRTVRLELT